MSDPIKPKTECLADFTSTMNPGEVRSIPVSSLSRDDWRQIRESNPVETVQAHMNAGSDRDLVIVSVGMIERLLAELVRRSRGGNLLRLRSDLNSLTQYAFENGLIEDRDRIGIDAVRHVRNEFAHDAALTSMEYDDSIQSHLSTTGLGGRPPGLSIRQHFGIVAMGLCGHLHHLVAIGVDRAE